MTSPTTTRLPIRPPSFVRVTDRADGHAEHYVWPGQLRHPGRAWHALCSQEIHPAALAAPPGLFCLACFCRACAAGARVDQRLNYWARVRNRLAYGRRRRAAS